MTNSLLSSDEARSVLEPLLGAFINGHLRAWSKWERLQKVCVEAEAPELTLVFDATTRANIVNNYCIVETVALIEPLVEPNRIEINSQLGFATVIIREPTRAALVRFKMLDADKRASNVKTKRQIALARQEWEPDLLTALGFPGTQPPTVLTCGYKLTEDESAIEGIHLVLQQNGICWAEPIWGSGRASVEDLTLDSMPVRTPIVRSGRKADDDAGGGPATAEGAS